eukprot:10167506-Alexandrium_andersonii.AAC.1
MGIIVRNLNESGSSLCSCPFAMAAPLATVRADGQGAPPSMAKKRSLSAAAAAGGMLDSSEGDQPSGPGAVR